MLSYWRLQYAVIKYLVLTQMLMVFGPVKVKVKLEYFYWYN